MTIALRDMALRAPSNAGAVRKLLAETKTILARWRARAAERMLLAQMSEREIRDLGLSHSDILFEINKPFWRD